MDQYLMIAPPKAPSSDVLDLGPKLDDPVPKLLEASDSPMSSCDDEDETLEGNAMDLLPDDIISLCLMKLTARDLVHMEMLSKRLRDLVLMNNRLWRDKVRARWGLHTNNSLMESAAVYAGGWKNLYAEKHLSEKKYKPWVIPGKSEVQAMLEVIRGTPSVDEVGSPTSVLSDSENVEMPQMPQMPQMPVELPQRKRDLSVLLLLDGSSSVTREDFDSMKDFARSLIENLKSYRPNSGVGLIQFNQSPRVIIPITHVSDDAIVQKVDKMQQLMGSTDIAAPIRCSYETLREDGNTGGEAVVLLLSDGQTSTTELEASQREARRAAEEMNVRLFAFGVGRDVDEMGLHRIATSTKLEAKVQDDGTVIPERGGGVYYTLRRMERSML